MSRGVTTAFQAPVADRDADLWDTCRNEIQYMTDSDHYPKATFSGGCFWCLQPPFDALDGVVATVVGYTGGRKTDPAYKDVAAGRTAMRWPCKCATIHGGCRIVNYWTSSGTTSILPSPTGNSVPKGRSIVLPSFTTTRPKST
jgi:hypothetical protein